MNFVCMQSVVKCASVAYRAMIANIKSQHVLWGFNDITACNQYTWIIEISYDEQAKRCCKQLGQRYMYKAMHLVYCSQAHQGHGKGLHDIVSTL